MGRRKKAGDGSGVDKKTPEEINNPPEENHERLRRVAAEFSAKAPYLLESCEKVIDHLDYVILWADEELKKTSWGTTITDANKKTKTSLEHIKGLIEEAQRGMKEAAKLVSPPRITRREKLYSIREAAEVVGLNAEVLRRHIVKGKVAAVKVGRDWKINHSEVVRIKQKGMQS